MSRRAVPRHPPSTLAWESVVCQAPPSCPVSLCQASSAPMPAVTVPQPLIHPCGHTLDGSSPGWRGQAAAGSRVGHAASSPHPTAAAGTDMQWGAARPLSESLLGDYGPGQPHPVPRGRAGGEGSNMDSSSDLGMTIPHRALHHSHQAKPLWLGI